ncbi:hypothetical protein IQ37_17955 [Chryseobacterium piperi]|uniref:RCK N-terminal domain-containing protein n=1 Tax=Chryseobacterium piperi TaxID=558152 RepID=A0A086AHP6_9FLAO|nr:hypothetical protein [Chryseobacterium piperi]ASW73902.1 hypothetical protein CJF12_06070 [Chryseobacterium piperi]KFF16210.1 hypothetical protein IQ37_17955 [Chryseobacterium piperi]
MKKAGIIGCGWLGSRIAEVLSKHFEMYTTITNPDKIEQLESKGFHPRLANFPDYLLTEKHAQWDVINKLDILIITIPLSGKSCCVSSLYNRIQNLLSFIGEFNGQLFLMSSTGVYPDLSKEFSEEDMPSDRISGERMIKAKYPQVNVLRLAGLMGDDRFLSKYKVSNLNFFVNHIHYMDVCSVIKKMIEKQVHSKVYNVVAPIHPVKSEVISIQKNVPHSEELNAEGKIILSSRLISELNFTFIHADPRYFHQLSSTEGHS